MTYYVYRRPWDYAVRRKSAPANRPKTATSVTPRFPDFVPADHIRPRSEFKRTNTTNRRLLVPVLSRFPNLPSIVDEPIDRPQVHRRSGFRQAQTPLWLAPQPVVGKTVELPAHEIKRVHRRSGRRNEPVLPLVPPEIAATDTSAAVPPHELPRAHRRHGYHRLLTVELISTGIATLGSEPGAIFKTVPHKIEHKRRLLTPPELNVHPGTGTSAATIAAVVPVVQSKRRPRAPIEIGSTAVILDNRTAATPLAPSFFPVRQFVRHTPRTLQRLPEHNEYPNLDIEDIRVWRDRDERVFEVRARRAQTVPPIAELLRDRTVLQSWHLETAIRRQETARRLLTPLTLNAYTATTVPEVVYAALQRPEPTPRTRLRRRQQVLQVSIYRGYPSQLAGGLGAAVYVKTGIHPNDVYLSGDITDAVYLQGDIQETVYLITGLTDAATYLQGDITDMVYVETDFNL